MANDFQRHVKAMIVRNPVSAVAALVMLFLVVIALVGTSVAPHDPYATNMSKVLQAPSEANWFGTDQVGRDVFSRVLVAARLDLAIAFSAVLVSFALGTLIGSASGYMGGKLDKIIGRTTDVLLAFPLFVVAMALVAAFGNTVQNVVLATAVVNLPFYVRLARGEVSTRRNATYVEAARISGNSDLKIILFFMLPNALPAMVVQMSTNLGWAVLNTASLSFIGLGIHAPTAEWGIMVAEGASNIMGGYWWLALFPGMALTLTVLCFNLLGDSLRDIIDVKTRH